MNIFTPRRIKVPVPIRQLQRSDKRSNLNRIYCGQITDNNTEAARLHVTRILLRDVAREVRLHDCRQNIMRIPFLKLPAALIVRADEPVVTRYRK